MRCGFPHPQISWLCCDGFGFRRRPAFRFLNQIKRFLDEFEHSSFCGNGVAGENRIGDFLVIACAGTVNTFHAICHSNAEPQGCFGDRAQLQIKPISGRRQNGHVKCNVCRKRIVVALIRRDHPLDSVFDRGLFGWAGHERCQRGSLWLDRQTNLSEFSQEGKREFALKKPAKDIWIEKVPIPFRLDPGPLTRACAQQAFCRQHFDGLAQNAPACAILGTKIGFDGKRIL